MQPLAGRFSPGPPPGGPGRFRGGPLFEPFVKCSAAVAACLGVLSFAAAPASADERPNVVLVVADDLAPQWTGFMGGRPEKALTPTLDRLADEGAALVDLHSTSPVCTPSRYTLLTGHLRQPRHQPRVHGTRPARNGGQTAVGLQHPPRSPNRTTSPERLQTAGYTHQRRRQEPRYRRRPGRRTPVPYDSRRSTDKATQGASSPTTPASRPAPAYHEAGFDFAESLYHGNPDADGIKRARRAQPRLDHPRGAVDFIDERRRTSPSSSTFATTIPHGPHGDDRSSCRPTRGSPSEGLLDDRHPTCRPHATRRSPSDCRSPRRRRVERGERPVAR